MKQNFTKQLAGLLLMAAPFFGTAQHIQGPSSSQTPFLKDTMSSGVVFKSIISANDAAPNGYKFAGIPDGVGAFDNGNGTFTVLINHEIGNTLGAVRAHGAKGAFVSKWIIKKSDLSVVSGSDLMQKFKAWVGGTSYKDSAFAFGRFCSADLPEVTAFYNSNSGNGTQNRIFMNGEETGAEGKAVAHIVTGAAAGVSYELPYLGKFAWENAVALPLKNTDKTVVAGMDDGTGGQVYFYIGTKTNTGLDIEKAGLTNGKLYGLKVTGVTTEARSPLNISAGAAFTLEDLGNVSTKTGAQLETASVNAGVTTFLRPEDGTWNPNDLSEFYFATTDRYDGVKDGASSQVGRSRLWKLKFSDINNPENGGTIEAVLDGTEAGNMFDNICFDNNGNMILLEDVGGNAHNGKVFQYTPATDVLTMIAKHDASRFGDIGKSATSPFNNDEETSGVIDVSCILGNGWFLIVDQAHSTTGMPSDVVENGQFLAMYNPGSVFSSPSGSNSVCVGSSISLSHNALNGVWSSVAGRAWVNTNGVVTGTSAGNALIKYTATNATGCTLSATKTVVVSALPAIPTIGIVPGTPSIVGGGGYCKNKTFSVIGKPTGGSWSSTGAFSISNSGLITTSSTPGAGSVSYAVTNANGCISSRTINANVVTCASKGINDSRNVNNQFTMYPNPAKSTINISVETLVGAGSIVVVDMYGKQVKTQPLSLGNNTVDIANLAKGFYFVSTITSEGKSTKKLVVE